MDELERNKEKWRNKEEQKQREEHREMEKEKHRGAKRQGGAERGGEKEPVKSSGKRIRVNENKQQRKGEKKWICEQEEGEKHRRTWKHGSKS